MTLSPDSALEDSQLLIAGASARSAACSAIRSRLQPISLDMFADEDLKRIGETHRVDDYPRGLPSLADAIEPCRWIYTGALENYPDVVASISKRHLLCGNSPDVLSNVRDPFTLAEILESANLPSLGLRRHAEPPVADGTWLLKQIQSSNGTGVFIWNEAAATQFSPDRGHYFQEFKQGTSMSALFLAARNATFLIGVAEQFVAGNDPLLRPFTFCGAIAPITDQKNAVDAIERIGCCVAEKCELRGLFGCDFVANDNTAWLAEVNPRYTATTELYEMSFDAPLLRWHLMACESFDATQRQDLIAGEWETQVAERQNQPHPRFFSKRILYAEFSVKTGSLTEFCTNRGDSGQFPLVADIPANETVILPGQPICTVFAEAATVDECLEKLAARTVDVQRSLEYQPTLESYGQSVASS